MSLPMRTDADFALRLFAATRDFQAGARRALTFTTLPLP